MGRRGGESKLTKRESLGVLVLREKCGSEFGGRERNSTGKREVRDFLGGKEREKPNLISATDVFETAARQPVRLQYILL